MTNADKIRAMTDEELAEWIEINSIIKIERIGIAQGAIIVYIIKHIIILKIAVTASGRMEFQNG